MDKTEIKRQISYWETQLKEGEKAVKARQDQNATIKATIKALRGLLGKDSEEEKSVWNASKDANTADGFTTEETR